jgi:hypothetical protein
MVPDLSSSSHMNQSTTTMSSYSSFSSQDDDFSTIMEDMPYDETPATWIDPVGYPILIELHHLNPNNNNNNNDNNNDTDSVSTITQGGNHRRRLLHQQFGLSEEDIERISV